MVKVCAKWQIQRHRNHSKLFHQFYCQQKDFFLHPNHDRDDVYYDFQNYYYENSGINHNDDYPFTTIHCVSFSDRDFYFSDDHGHDGGYDDLYVNDGDDDYEDDPIANYGDFLFSFFQFILNHLRPTNRPLTNQRYQHCYLQQKNSKKYFPSFSIFHR